MTRNMLLAVACLGLGGCQHPAVTPMTGTQLDDDGKVRTYVTEEEYERMTPDERARLHAARGVSTTWGNSSKSPAPVTLSDLNKALSADEAPPSTGKK